MPLTIKWNCVTKFCNKNNFKNIKYKKNDKVIVEYRSSCGKYIADIAVINKDKIRYIFEIKYTHETITDVRPEPWFEIEAEKIINTNININNIIILYCIRCTGRRLCNLCFNIYKHEGRPIKEIYNAQNNDLFDLCVMCKKSWVSEENNTGVRDRCINCAAHVYCIDPKNYLYTNKILRNPKKYLNDIIYGTILNCTFKDKDLVKKYGAKWDVESKKWYVPRGTSLYKFEQWL